MNRKERRATGKAGEADALAAAGVAAFGRGDLAGAEAAFRKAVAARPNFPQAWSNLGVVLLGQGKAEESVAACRKATTQAAAFPDAHFNLGNAMKALGRLEEAADAYGRAVALRPDYPEAHCNLGSTLDSLGRLEGAAAAYGRAIALRPDLAEAHCNLGLTLERLGRLEDAAAAHRRAIALRPDLAEAHCNLGSALRLQGWREEAVAAYRQAVAVRPAYAEAWANMGVALHELGHADDALAAYERALALRPDYADAMANQAAALKDLGRVDEALAAFGRAVTIKPDFAEAFYSLGCVLQELGKRDLAIAAYEQALQARPGYPEAMGQLVHQRRHACDWSRYEADEAAVLADVRAGRGRVAPFGLLCQDSTMADQLACARNWSKSMVVPEAARFRHSPATATATATAKPRLRLGYLSPDFRSHPVASLVAEVFERHDRTRFEVIGYSTGPDDGSDMRRRLEAGFDRFVDLHRTPLPEAARRIHADGIDILVDLGGHTQHSRFEIMAWRPAPLQVEWLGYPGAMGADFIDYTLADAIVAPPEHQAFYTEKLAWLPHCYQSNDSRRLVAAETPSRAECGLPAEGMVFCCFNNSFKFTPAVFSVWMRLLLAVPGSVLWLLEANDLVRANLNREAAARGVDPARLVWAPRLPSPQHLARHRLADLFLDTLPYNAHTTASDALWAGLPVLTVLGETFAGRVAASLLSAVGLPDLIASSLSDYESRALRLSRDISSLRNFRTHLSARNSTSALFDVKAFVSGLEATLETMFRSFAEK